jgi:hypothetical protein
LVEVGYMMNMMMISNCGIADQDFIYIFKIYIEFRSFGGICCGGILTLQKTRFGGPGKSSLWSVLDYCFLRVFMGLDEFLQVFDFFFADCGEAASSKVLLTKTCFFGRNQLKTKF